MRGLPCGAAGGAAAAGAAAGADGQAPGEVLALRQGEAEELSAFQRAGQSFEMGWGWGWGGVVGQWGGVESRLGRLLRERGVGLGGKEVGGEEQHSSTGLSWFHVSQALKMTASQPDTHSGDVWVCLV